MTALSDLRFREPHVLVQFWSPDTLWKRFLLTTLNQPFGIGAVDEGLYLYRLESESRIYVVDGKQTEDLGPPGRVYRRKLPEWSLDVNGWSTGQNVKDWSTSCNIHGYINLPVFEPDSGICVGVLEIVASSKYVDYAFEVKEVSRALKIQIADERRQHELNEISSCLKTVCDIQDIPLAQTWTLAGYNSFVSNSGKLERSCSSYNSTCIGKVCMSTYDLPYYIRDFSMWGYHVACKETHLEKSRGIVGRSLSSRVTYFCMNVTELDKDEYPLVPHARLNGITSCLAVYLRSIGRDVEYVIEFVLPPRSANVAGLQRLVKTMKHQVEKASSVQLVSRPGTHMLDGHAQPEITITEQFIESTVKKLTIKATYKEDMVKFPLRLSDGLARLKELIRKRFPLGSFKLKYKDKDGDMIWISCDRSLMESIAEFRQPDGQTVIRLFVLPDA
ncbi:NIN-like protein [Artemisia annua]|uniref:NIN-like protein n=1 Tax=Artemisia annua TaxID=35608 RepID=A0A2U1M3Y8_ARTAN|nr:NIN-like protein [Artemisia annua]